MKTKGAVVLHHWHFLFSTNSLRLVAHPSVTVSLPTGCRHLRVGNTTGMMDPGSLTATQGTLAI